MRNVVREQEWKRSLGRAWGARLDAAVAGARSPAEAAASVARSPAEAAGPALAAARAGVERVEGWRAWLCAVVPVSCSCRARA